MRFLLVLIAALSISTCYAQRNSYGIYPSSYESKRFSLKPSQGRSYFLIGDKGYLEVDGEGTVENKIRTRKVKFFNLSGELQNEYTFSLDFQLYAVNGSIDEFGPYFLIKKAPDEILIIHLKEKGFTQHEISLIDPMIVYNFDVVNDKAIIGGIMDYRPMFFLYNFQTQGISPFDALYNTKKEFVESHVDLKQGIVTLFSQASGVYNIKNFSLEGQLLSSQDVTTGINDKILRSARVSRLVDGSQFVVGTYSDLGTQLYTGLYVIKYDLQGRSNSVFTPYFKLDNFFDHLPDSRKDRVVSRAKAKWERRETWSTAMNLRFREPFFKGKYAVATALCFNGPYKNIFSIGLDLDNLEFNILSLKELQKFRTKGEIPGRILESMNVF